jgi:formylglycine-generating enzyme required for sulfatase activity
MLQNRPRVVAIAFFVLLAIGYSLYRWLVIASLSVTSVPPGAEVSLDGKRIGLTPLQADVPTGVHQVTVQHTFYRVYQERLDIRSGDSLQRLVSLDAGVGELHLLSNPKGAWVEIDGERQTGRTPMRVDLPGGTHEVLIGHAERKSAGRIVEVKADQVNAVNLDLPMDPHGTLNVQAKPSDALVELIGLEQPYTPRMRLPIGEYGLRVSKPGFVTQEIRYYLKYAASAPTVQLVREFGALQLSVSPNDAQVLVAFVRNGESRVETYTSDMQIPVGEFQVRSTAMLYRTLNRNYSMTGAGRKLELTLPLMNVEVGAVIKDPLAVGGSAPELVVVPAGSFIMGNDQGPPSERPARRVTITQPFAVGRYEVSIADYRLFADSVNREMPHNLKRGDEQWPMHLVSWKDATAYADWLSKQTGQRYRLPSEAEWEYVARAGSTTLYGFGDNSENVCEYANVADQSTGLVYRDWRVANCEDGFSRLAPIGSRKPNAFGLFDTSGNVSEWVQECGMPQYRSALSDGSVAGPKGCDSHGHRGGSWDSSGEELTTPYRNSASSSNQDRGFRLIREM